MIFRRNDIHDLLISNSKMKTEILCSLSRKSVDSILESRNMIKALVDSNIDFRSKLKFVKYIFKLEYKLRRKNDIR